MITYIETKRRTPLYRALSAFIAISFLLSSVLPPQMSYAQITPQTILNLPAVGSMVPISSVVNPPMIKGMTIHPDNPFLFDFIIHPGDDALEGEALREESNKMIKYFLAALTTPEEEMWVNLSPYEKDRIVPKEFGQTEMGRDLLAQDYMLKQLAASLMYPEDELGKKFWKRIRKKAYEQFGTTEIPLDTYNKIWIVPERAVIYEHGTTAVVVESHLKVMMEEDYLALSQQTTDNRLQTENLGLSTDDRRLSSEIIRDIIIPEIEKEVNEGQTFATLRQITNAVILASWYKENVQGSILEQFYINQGKTKGIDSQDPEINQKIYNQYLDAFKKGVYDFIKEEYDPATQDIIPRKYFSGGLDYASIAKSTKFSKVPLYALVAVNGAMTVTTKLTNAAMVVIDSTTPTAPTGRAGRVDAAMQVHTLTAADEAAFYRKIRKRLGGMDPEDVRELFKKLVSIVLTNKEFTLNGKPADNFFGGLHESIHLAIDLHLHSYVLDNVIFTNLTNNQDYFTEINKRAEEESLVGEIVSYLRRSREYSNDPEGALAKYLEDKSALWPREAVFRIIETVKKYQLKLEAGGRIEIKRQIDPTFLEQELTALIKQETDPDQDLAMTTAPGGKGTLAEERVGSLQTAVGSLKDAAMAVGMTQINILSQIKEVMREDDIIGRGVHVKPKKSLGDLGIDYIGVELLAVALEEEFRLKGRALDHRLSTNTTVNELVNAISELLHASLDAVAANLAMAEDTDAAMVTVGDEINHVLKEVVFKGVTSPEERIILTYPGVTITQLLNDFVRSGDFRVVKAAPNEFILADVAYGLAQLHGVSVAAVTHGVGVKPFLAELPKAMNEDLPIIVFAGGHSYGENDPDTAGLHIPDSPSAKVSNKNSDIDVARALGLEYYGHHPRNVLNQLFLEPHLM